jgi:hypothetical protein
VSEISAAEKTVLGISGWRTVTQAQQASDAKSRALWSFGLRGRPVPSLNKDTEPARDRHR